VNPSQRKVLWTASASHGLIHVYELAVPALLLLIQQEFGAGDFAMGRVVTAYGLLFGLGALPAGYLVDRIGSRHLLVLCLWGSAASLLGMAFSPSLLGFGLAAACMGLCLSIYHPAGTSLLTHSMPLSGRIFALHGMAGNSGVAVASVIAGTLGAAFGWRWALGLLALLGLTLGFRVLGLSVPEQQEVRARKGRGRWPDFALLLLAILFMGVVYRGMTTFLPKYFATRLADEAGTGTALGGLLTTLALGVGLVGIWAGGRLADRGLSAPASFLLGAAMQTPFLVALGFVASPLLVPAAMGVAFFHFLTQPPGNYMVADFTPPRLRGLGYGIYFFVSFGAGSVGAALGGWISERAGLSRTFPVLAAVLLPSAAAMLVLLAMRRRRSVGSHREL
jgi:predicted MFS family arabinose efflux permease